jgi:repressor LexA
MRYMISFATERGKQPSVREIGKAAGLQSTSTTAGYLRRMVNEGLLEQTTKGKRNYFVTRNAAELLRNAG